MLSVDMLDIVYFAVCKIQGYCSYASIFFSFLSLPLLSIHILLPSLLILVPLPFSIFLLPSFTLSLTLTPHPHLSCTHYSHTPVMYTPTNPAYSLQGRITHYWGLPTVGPFEGAWMEGNISILALHQGLGPYLLQFKCYDVVHMPNNWAASPVFECVMYAAIGCYVRTKFWYWLPISQQIVIKLEGRCWLTTACEEEQEQNGRTHIVQLVKGKLILWRCSTTSTSWQHPSFLWHHSVLGFWNPNICCGILQN